MPAHARAFDAVVLAGGRSTRLGGADKPGLVVGPRTLLGSVVWAVTEAGASRVVVVGPQRPAALGAATLSPGTGRDGQPGHGRPRYGRPGTGGPGTGGPGTGSLAAGGPGARGGEQVRYTREDPPGGGPVAALRCGLAEVSAPGVVLLAADLPFLRPVHVTRLLAAAGRPGRPRRGTAGYVRPAPVAGQLLASGGAARRPGGLPGQLTARGARPAGAGAAARRDGRGGAASLAGLRHRR